MSIDNRQLGGISSYFSPPSELKCGPGRAIKIEGFTSWASNVMPSYRFHQICAALHPEIGSSTVGDRCHQLRASIVSLNTHAKWAFILGQQCLFDEGGIASKTRYNSSVRITHQSQTSTESISLFW